MVSSRNTREFDNPVVEATFYTERSLFSRRGRESERIAARWLRNALEKAELNYDITFDLPVIDAPEPRDVFLEPYKSWRDLVRDDGVPEVAKDTNVLLLDSLGGGRGSVSGSPGVCVVGANALEDRPYGLAGNGPHWKCAHDILHEIGHNFGFSHQPHAGHAFNGPDGTWHRTPTVGGNGVINQCGHFIDARTATGDTHHQYYHWCAIVNMDIEGEGSPSLPSEYPPTHNGQTVPFADEFPPMPEGPDEPPDDGDGDEAGQAGLGEIAALVGVGIGVSVLVDRYRSREE